MKYEDYEKRQHLWTNVAWNIDKRWYFPTLEKGQKDAEKWQKFFEHAIGKTRYKPISFEYFFLKWTNSKFITINSSRMKTQDNDAFEISYEVIDTFWRERYTYMQKSVIQKSKRSVPVQVGSTPERIFILGSQRQVGIILGIEYQISTRLVERERIARELVKAYLYLRLS